MLFSPSAEKFHQDFSPRDLSPYAKLVGEIAEIKKRTNQLTKQTFLIATINYPAGDLPVLFPDRKSTRLNSSHVAISYAVFCLKKKLDYIKLYNNCRHV